MNKLKVAISEIQNGNLKNATSKLIEYSTSNCFYLVKDLRVILARLSQLDNLITLGTISFESQTLMFNQLAHALSKIVEEIESSIDNKSDKIKRDKEKGNLDDMEIHKRLIPQMVGNYRIWYFNRSRQIYQGKLSIEEDMTCRIESIPISIDIMTIEIKPVLGNIIDVNTLTTPFIIEFEFYHIRESIPSMRVWINSFKKEEQISRGLSVSFNPKFRNLPIFNKIVLLKDESEFHIHKFSVDDINHSMKNPKLKKLFDELRKYEIEDNWN